MEESLSDLWGMKGDEGVVVGMWRKQRGCLRIRLVLLAPRPAGCPSVCVFSQRMYSSVSLQSLFMGILYCMPTIHYQKSDKAPSIYSNQPNSLEN